MIPPHPGADAPDSERRLFAELERQLQATWTVFHARTFVEAGSGAEGEIDFLVAAPDRGLLVLEVKGGGIERDESGWHSVDRHGARHPLRDPSAQATRGARWLRRFGRERKVWKGERDVPPVEWAVAFPDVIVRAGGGSGALDPALPRERVLDHDDLTKLRDRCEALLPLHAAGVGAPGAAAVHPGLTRERLAALGRELAPVFRLVPCPLAQRERESEAFERLTADQLVVLEGLAANRRVAVSGGAGTGKTLLARELARRRAREGERVLLLCFNRLLAETLALDGAGSGPDAPGYEVSTLHALSERLSKEAGLAWNPDAAKDVQRFFREESIDLLLEALDRLPERRWATVVVDEGQDFLAPWWLAVESLLADPKQGRLWVFHDPAQSIFGGEVPADDLGLVRYDLPWNCRNTRRIAEWAARLTGKPPRCRAGAPEGEPPTERTVRTEEEMLDAVRKSLHELVKERGFPPERTLVLTAASLEKSRIWKQRGKLPYPLIRYSPKTPPKRGEVPMSSLAAFKGLEADAVVLCEIRPGSHSCTPAHLAIGATRAKHGLAVARYREDDESGLHSSQNRLVSIRKEA